MCRGGSLGGAAPAAAPARRANLTDLRVRLPRRPIGDAGDHLVEGERERGQVVGTPYLDGFVSYGTRVPATGTLVWYSPDANQPPIPVSGQASGKGEILVKGVALTLERRGDEWIVTRR